MSSHDAFDEAVVAYALGVLDEAERHAFEAHLETCADCQRERAALDRLSVALGMAAGPVAPPPSLRARTLARAASRPFRRPAPPIRTWTWLTAAAGIIVGLGLLGYIVTLRAQVRSLQRAAVEAMDHVEVLRAELEEARQHSADLTTTLRALTAPDLVRIDLRNPSPASAAAGRAFVTGARGVLFTVENLPVLPAGRIYQVWAVVEGSGPVGVGLFSVDADGASSVPLVVPASLARFRTLAVTVEPAGGSPGPTSGIVLIGNRSS